MLSVNANLEALLNIIANGMEMHDCCQIKGASYGLPSAIKTNRTSVWLRSLMLITANRYRSLIVFSEVFTANRRLRLHKLLTQTSDKIRRG